MIKKKPTLTKITARIDSHLLDQMRQLKESQGISMKDLLEHGIRWALIDAVKPEKKEKKK